jgi:CubicO group peptidase (beta-lactamase class C family)
MLLLWSAGIATAGIAGWASNRLWRIAAIGSAYRSKVLASLVFGSGRAVDPRRVEEVSSDSYRLLQLFRSTVDPAAQTVTTSLLGLRSRTAVHRPGLGATLLFSDAGTSLDDQGAPRHSASIDAATVSPSNPASLKIGTAARLQHVVDRAFAEPDPERKRRTRAVVVLRDGEIVAERYAGGFDVGTRLAGWSMTKSVMNALVGILIKDGRLSLQDAALMPAWQPPDPRSAITVEDLLRMRSGLKFTEAYSDFSSDVIEMLFNRADTAAYAASQALIAAPGATWSYASGTTNILSAIVRRAVSDEYFGWPRRTLFEPLGMTSAILEPDASGTFVCSSFMLATARDWARFGQLFLQDGVWNGRRILPDGWVAFSTTPTPQSPKGNYGAHWWLKLQPEVGGSGPSAAAIPSDAFFAIGHEAQTLTIIPSHRLVVVRLGLSIYIDAWNQADFVAAILDAL